MKQYHYPTSIVGTSTKTLKIYTGTSKIGEIKGYYDNVIKKIIDNYTDRSNPFFIRYQIIDEYGSVRFTSKNGGALKRKVYITYLSDNGTNHELIMLDTKHFDGFGEKGVNFNFNGKDYYIIKHIFEPAQLFHLNNLIADWNIEHRSGRVVIKIFEQDYLDEYLIIGLFHAWFYASKG
ncbi:tubby C-terminal domain-like protein [Cytobacillus horneckiae]|uniref:Tubby C-terminal domain-containing protein n=1 Tax=Cytobacillus horneckiae TaxID=549687 RepID=A0A2N0ZB44_9BACI|nr:hypothetical protein [Cytobacillus horneckiae]MEC1155533.1 hypothetical protein [Cytobacillus horneckiae]MED2936852.1 hypothetical protein [Cytobacillus horneckiae]PKG26728.1 hypothetical protein CWS20_22365 [Cytobacillus horneckiae]